MLEGRIVLNATIPTYTWTALGDGSSFNDPNNWSHIGPFGGGVGVTGVPTLGSNLIFPSFGLLPANSPTTIDFNYGVGNFPVNVLQIGDSYTFTGNGISVASGIGLSNSYYGKPADATILLTNVSLGRQAFINTDPNSILNLGSSTDTTGVRLTLQGGATKIGGGQLIVDTSAITDPRPLLGLPTFEIAGGAVTLGVSASFSNTLFQVDAQTALNIADNAAIKVGSLSGSGTVNLEGTTTAGDLTSLTAFTPNAQADTFSGQIIGVGQFGMQGNGQLTLGGIDFGDAGTISVGMGALVVNGPISAGNLNVNGGSFGGSGSWHFSGPVTFAPASTFNLALDGPPGIGPSTLLTSSNTTSGINLGNSSLAGSVNYEYQAGDTFTIATAPTIQGGFQNVLSGGLVLLGGSIPFVVRYSPNAVTITAQQSLTTTTIGSSVTPGHPGQAITFTANVRTRTTAVDGGSVNFLIGGNVVATVPVVGGTARFTTTTLPLGTATISAVYSGAGNILGSSSAPLSQDIVPYTTVTTLSSTINPSRFRQPVTLIASVTADGMPVTSGTVRFVRGNVMLGVAALGADGTAWLTTSALPRHGARLQALYSGTPEDYGSVSPVYLQNVQKAQTSTSLALSQTRIHHRERIVLRATVVAVGPNDLNPRGIVVFHRGRRVVGRARLVRGTATIVLRRRFRPATAFVATFRGNRRFGRSRSLLVTIPDVRVPVTKTRRRPLLPDRRAS